MEHGQAGASIVKSTVKIVRQRTEDDPWRLYFGALRCSYERYLSETTDARFALFQDLVARISSAYGGVNVKGRAHLVELVRECAHHGLVRPPSRLAFVEQVVSSMASKLSPPAASQMCVPARLPRRRAGPDRPAPIDRLTSGPPPARAPAA